MVAMSASSMQIAQKKFRKQSLMKPYANSFILSGVNMYRANNGLCSENVKEMKLFLQHKEFCKYVDKSYDYQCFMTF